MALKSMAKPPTLKEEGVRLSREEAMIRLPCNIFNRNVTVYRHLARMKELIHSTGGTNFLRLQAQNHYKLPFPVTNSGNKEPNF